MLETIDGYISTMESIEDLFQSDIDDEELKLPSQETRQKCIDILSEVKELFKGDFPEGSAQLDERNALTILWRGKGKRVRLLILPDTHKSPIINIHWRHDKTSARFSPSDMLRWLKWVVHSEDIHYID